MININVDASDSKIFILGGYDMEEKAAKAYDLAALKYWGPSSHINFPVRRVFILLYIFYIFLFNLWALFPYTRIEMKLLKSYNNLVIMFNFKQQLENYQKEIEEMKDMTRQEYVAHLRRKSSGFSRGASMYRGVTRSFSVNLIIIKLNILK